MCREIEIFSTRSAASYALVTNASLIVSPSHKCKNITVRDNGRLIIERAEINSTRGRNLIVEKIICRLN